MNTTPRVVTRGIATDIRTSCVQGTSSPTASPQNAPAPAGRAADIVPHGPPGGPTGPPGGSVGAVLPAWARAHPPVGPARQRPGVAGGAAALQLRPTHRPRR